MIEAAVILSAVARHWPDFGIILTTWWIALLFLSLASHAIVDKTRSQKPALSGRNEFTGAVAGNRPARTQHWNVSHEPTLQELRRVVLLSATTGPALR